MAALLDANVWLPLVWEEHAFHRKTLAWVGTQAGPLCFCRVTQLALLRHLSNKAILGEDALTNAKSLALVERLVAQESVLALDEPPDLWVRFSEYGGIRTASPQLWTDAYLAAFAAQAGTRLATYDKGFRRFKGLELELL